MFILIIYSFQYTCSCRENVRAKEKRKDVIASDQIEMKIGCSVDIRQVGDVDYMQTLLN